MRNYFLSYTFTQDGIPLFGNITAQLKFKITFDNFKHSSNELKNIVFEQNKNTIKDEFLFKRDFIILNFIEL